MSLEHSEKNHFFIRVADGVNFKNSKYPMWGFKSCKGGTKTYINNHMKSGDILWFITSKMATKTTSIVVGMAEYVDMFDRHNEDLIKFNTYTNKDMGWTLDTNWDIQISYKNLYCGKTIEKHNFYTPFPGSGFILKLENVSRKTPIDFKNEYELITNYAEPSKYFE
tara:strand:- start:102 stop:599 length:498 start_codon:yes stop_codon:yes gene_type:complete